ncbi:MAG: hypothetical protein ABII26_11550 [Pseudomonadota bacterium]
MDPSHLIPFPDPIPVPWVWVEFLLLLTFVIHLLFMNTMIGTGIIAFVYHIRRPRAISPLTEDISKMIPYAIAFTVNMGVAPLLFLQVLYGHFIYVSSVLMAVYWISIIVLLILAYYSAYIYDFRYEALGSFRLFFIGLSVAIFLLIGFFITNNMTLMIKPEAWGAYFGPDHGRILNLSDPTLWPRYLHFMTASVALGGLFIAMMPRLKRPRDLKDRDDRITLGMRWFSYATLAQIAIGLWFLMALPPHLKMRFMGGDFFYSGVFVVGIAGAVVSLIFGFKQRVVPAAISVIGTIILMVIIRDLVRWGYLNRYFTPSSLKLIHQYSPFILFVCSLVIVLVVIGYMLRLASRIGKGV